MITYFNGRFLDKSEVRISPDDRGFVFADGLYEVIRSYDGSLFRCDEHLQRLEVGCRALRFSLPPVADVRRWMRQLLDQNRMEDATLYIQVTRGCAPRKHRFPPAETPLTIYIEPKPLEPCMELHTQGAKAILVPDLRWARCDIKSVALLPNVLAQQRAFEAGAWEALLVRDGAILEGSHSNVFFVKNDTLVTAPLNNYILPGITRQAVLELAVRLGLRTKLDVFYEQERAELQEAFIASTTMEVQPIVSIDDQPVGKGFPGPLTRQLQLEFRTLVKETLGQGSD